MCRLCTDSIYRLRIECTVCVGSVPTVYISSVATVHRLVTSHETNQHCFKMTVLYCIVVYPVNRRCRNMHIIYIYLYMLRVTTHFGVPCNLLGVIKLILIFNSMGLAWILVVHWGGNKTSLRITAQLNISQLQLSTYTLFHNY